MRNSIESNSVLRFERLLWLMPAAYAIHICEEWFAGFPQYIVEKMRGSPMPGPVFFTNNAVFMVVMLVLCAWASHSGTRRSAFFLMSWSSGNLFWNFVVHLYFTVATGSFSPGLVTGTLFYYPIPLIIAALAVRQGRLSLPAMLSAFAVGGVMMFLIIWGGVYHFAT